MMSICDRYQQIYAIWQQLDQDILELRQTHQQQGGTIYCRQGCGNCCTLAVNCSYPEAALLATTLTDRQRHQILVKLPLLKQLCQAATGLKSFLQSYRDQFGGCPLLDAKANCSSYDSRPLSCRALLSTRPEAWCGIDFSTLHPLEKQAFLSSLDAAVVAYPSHYLAGPLERAAALERSLADEYAAQYQVHISGNMIWLLGLELNSQVGERLARKNDEILDWLLEQQKQYPYLMQVTLRTP